LALVLVTVIGLEKAGKVLLKDLPDPSVPGMVTSLRAALYAFLATAWFLSRTYNETLYILLALAGTLCHVIVGVRLQQQEPKPQLQFQPQAKVKVQPKPKFQAQPPVQVLQQTVRPMPWVRWTFACEFFSLIIIYLAIRFRTL